jgi:hypothetical protein
MTGRHSSMTQYDAQRSLGTTLPQSITNSVAFSHTISDFSWAPRAPSTSAIHPPSYPGAVPQNPVFDRAVGGGPIGHRHSGSGSFSTSTPFLQSMQSYPLGASASPRLPNPLGAIGSSFPPSHAFAKPPAVPLPHHLEQSLYSREQALAGHPSVEHLPEESSGDVMRRRQVSNFSRPRS